MASVVEPVFPTVVQSSNIRYWESWYLRLCIWQVSLSHQAHMWLSFLFDSHSLWYPYVCPHPWMYPLRPEINACHHLHCSSLIAWAKLSSPCLDLIVLVMLSCPGLSGILLSPISWAGELRPSYLCRKCYHPALSLKSQISYKVLLLDLIRVPFVRPHLNSMAL